MNSTAPSPLVHTPIATVQRTGSDLVEVRFHPGCVLSVGGISAILEVRDELGREARNHVLIVFPADELDFDLNMITTDHYGGRPVEQHTISLAWVVRNAHNERFTRLFFAYFPSPVPYAIFSTEEEAIDRLGGQRR
ncbi:MAG: hypothetical protein WAU70_17945 [Flavobacteriales bacterium]